MEFEVLGPLRVVGVAGEGVALGSDAQRRLASLLVLRANTIVPTHVLESTLFLSPGALRTSVHRLRRLIGADVLATTPPGYELRTDRIDALRFEGLLAVARQADPATAGEALGEALGLWRGEAYAEFAHEGWAIAEVQRLTELRAGATEDLVQLELDAGSAAAAVARVEALIDEHPLRERPRALLMRALAGSGRRPDALRAFQAYRSLLLDEIGTEPSAALVALDRAIATDRLEARRPAQGDHGVAPLDGRAGHNLPHPISSFVGREGDVSTVADLVGRHRLVTLTGTGGCGKTRLALEVAARAAPGLAGGTWWAELAEVSAPVQVVERVATSLNATPVAGEDTTTLLVRHLGRLGPVLLVLDSAEHLLDAVADLVQHILGGCPEATVVVTSREAIGVPGELIWRVPSMALPEPDQPVGAAELDEYDALHLFLERLRLARPGLVVDEATAGDVVSICAHLDGLPLALELAAASARTLPLDLVARGVAEAQQSLRAPTRGGVARHQTMRASIAWSVALLTLEEQLVLERLSTFVTPFLLDSAIAVAADDSLDEAAVVHAVGRLVDTSLVQLDDVSGRYRLLETTRQFCLGRLQGTSALHEIRHRHALHVSAWCSSIDTGRRGIERGPLVREMPEVVAALEWAMEHEPATAMRICAGLASVRSTLGHNSNTVATWEWLMRFDRRRQLRAEWAAAVAASMAAATGVGYDVSSVGAEVAALLDPHDDRAVGWLARGRAMGPAYAGDLRPMSAYVERVVAEGNDMETSVYVGFTAYMAALHGDLDAADRWLGELHRMTRRHRARFAVDSVGNGYAAEVMVLTARGRLGRAAQAARADLPQDPTFSMTAAAALAQLAVHTADDDVLATAEAWSRRATIQRLTYLATLVGVCGALRRGHVEAAAEGAEQHWDEAAAVVGGRVQPLPMLATALLEAGRVTVVEAALADGAARVATLPAGHGLMAQIHLVRAQLALCAGDSGTQVREALAALDLATASGLALVTVDALELVAAADVGPPIAERLAAGAQRERARLGYRWSIVPRPWRPAVLEPGMVAAGRPSGTLRDAVALAHLLADVRDAERAAAP